MLSYDTDGHMNTSLYDKRDDFNFSITNFPFLSSNIPSSPAYGVLISQLIRYARASTKYTDFDLRARRFSDKLLSQGYVCDRLTSSLRKVYGRYGELVIHYDVPHSRMVDDILKVPSKIGNTKSLDGKQSVDHIYGNSNMEWKASGKARKGKGAPPVVYENTVLGKEEKSEKKMFCKYPSRINYTKDSGTLRDPQLQPHERPNKQSK
ncbi:hypothetical protein FSP39_001649 [Pinctada imbricata]|uniref:Uncharacterized protein n=1 Tax=Pinctada imbricata TaxID=66713 RepID=A0AA88Y6Q3_PINIB|nr:hypothetical protein FSP39_001649 [Pinctada imbricata]